MKNEEAAQLLENIADLLEVKGESVFRVRAYRDAARSIEFLSEPIEEIVARGEAGDIPGVGESIEAKLREFVETGESAYYEELRRGISPGLAELLEIPGIGPKKARLFHDALGIDSIDELEAAAREHRLSTLPTIGAKTEQNVLDAIERVRARSGRTPLGTALPPAREFLRAVLDFPEVEHADLAGSLRRMTETVGDIDIIAASPDPPSAVDRFVALPGVKTVLGHGPTKGTIVTVGGVQIDLRVVKPDEYGSGLQHFTGSKQHNIRLRSLAEAAGLKVNEYGTFRISDGARVAGETEASVYEAVGLRWMAPELREDMGEIEAARDDTLPDLVQAADIRGDLHIHTDWSDGQDSVRKMILAAIARGYEYVAISDHSVSMAFVHGLTPERVLEQRRLIDELGYKYPQIHVLQGIEVNIRADGSLDYPDDILTRFDVVTASVHGGMTMERERMTERIIRAMEDPHVDIIGHPTGRLLGRREAYAVDMRAIVEAAVRTRTALEVNAQPDRLDLKDTDVRMARDSGAMIAIDSDSHSTEQLALIDYGIATARRGWARASDVLNALTFDRFAERLGIGRDEQGYAA